MMLQDDPTDAPPPMILRLKLVEYLLFSLDVIKIYRTTNGGVEALSLNRV